MTFPVGKFRLSLWCPNWEIRKFYLVLHAIQGVSNPAEHARRAKISLKRLPKPNKATINRDAAKYELAKYLYSLELIVYLQKPLR